MLDLICQLFMGLFIWGEPVRLVGLISPPYEAVLAYTLFPLELPLCLYEKRGWLARRDPGCSSRDITKRQPASSYKNNDNFKSLASR